MKEILCGATQIYIFMIVVRVVLSWFPVTSGNVFSQISYFIGRYTEPVLNRVRSVMPRTGALDLSPLVVLLFLQIVVQGIILKC